MLQNAEISETGGDFAASEAAAARIAGTYVTFDLAGQTLGVEVRHVREILDQVAISRLPNAPHELEGVVDIRGESIPIIDMGTRLGMPRMDDGEETRIIVFELQHEEHVRPMGVLADRVRDVTQILAEEVEDPPQIVGASWQAEQLRGFARHAGQLIFLLNIEAIFPSARSGELDPMYL